MLRKTIEASRYLLFACVFLIGACTVPEGDPSKGEQLFKQKTIGMGDAPGCQTCHSTVPEEVIVGPSLFGVTNRASETIASSAYHGEATTISEYLMESIKTPNAFVREGFTPGVMYQGFSEELTEEQMLDLIAFLKTLQ